jgi:hypothetical protein
MAQGVLTINTLDELLEAGATPQRDVCNIEGTDRGSEEAKHAALAS